MERFDILYQHKFEFNITNVGECISWYKKDTIKRPDYWKNYNFIADV